MSYYTYIYIILNIGDISESHLKSHMAPATFRNHLQSYQTVASQWKWSPKCWLLQPSPLGTQPVDSTCFIGAKFSKWSNYGPQGMNQDWVSGIEHNVNPGFNDGFHCGVAPYHNRNRYCKCQIILNLFYLQQLGSQLISKILPSILFYHGSSSPGYVFSIRPGIWPFWNAKSAKKFSTIRSQSRRRRRPMASWCFMMLDWLQEAHLFHGNPWNMTNIHWVIH